MTDKTRILCFGDSLTWGWIPTVDAAPTGRYPQEQRWTGVLAAELGEGYEIVEEGLSARTTNIDDPIDSRLSGAAYFPAALATHLPLDIVIIMLGTNDTKARYRRTPNDIATGMEQLVWQALGSAGGVGTFYPAPQVLVVAPPPLGEITNPWFVDVFEGGHEKSRDLAAAYEHLAAFTGVWFFDAGEAIATEGIDGIHLSAENNAVLGRALAQRIRELGSGSR